MKGTIDYIRRFFIALFELPRIRHRFRQKIIRLEEHLVIFGDNLRVLNQNEKNNCDIFNDIIIKINDLHNLNIKNYNELSNNIDNTKVAIDEVLPRLNFIEERLTKIPDITEEHLSIFSNFIQSVSATLRNQNRTLESLTKEVCNIKDSNELCIIDIVAKIDLSKELVKQELNKEADSTNNKLLGLKTQYDELTILIENRDLVQKELLTKIDNILEIQNLYNKHANDTKEIIKLNFEEKKHFIESLDSRLEVIKNETQAAITNSFIVLERSIENIKNTSLEGIGSNKDSIVVLNISIDELKNNIDNLKSEIDVDVKRVQDILIDREKRIEETSSRIEFIRDEIMFEVKHGKDTSPVKLHSAFKYKKIKKINIGCGHKPLEKYTNLDTRKLPGVDIVADASDLPFEDNQLDEIYSAHLIEHFANEELKRVILPEWCRVLKVGGKLSAVLPDWIAMMDSYRNGKYSFENLREVTFGKQEYDGDFHYNLFSKESIEKLLIDTGFKKPKFIAEARKNGNCYEFEFVSFKR